MKKEATATPEIASKPSETKAAAPPQSRIHPVIIYPFNQPSDYSDLEELYRLVAGLDADKKRLKGAFQLLIGFSAFCYSVTLSYPPG